MVSVEAFLAPNAQYNFTLSTSTSPRSIAHAPGCETSTCRRTAVPLGIEQLSLATNFSKNYNPPISASVTGISTTT